MKISENELKQYSEEVFKKRFYNYFVEGKYLMNDEISLDSYFLTPFEVKTCFKHSKGEYIRDIEGATTNLPSG